MAYSAPSEEFGASALHEAQIAGVIDEAGKIGVLVINPDGENMCGLLKPPDTRLRRGRIRFILLHCGTIAPAAAGCQAPAIPDEQRPFLSASVRAGCGVSATPNTRAPRATIWISSSVS